MEALGLSLTSIHKQPLVLTAKGTLPSGMKKRRHALYANTTRKSMVRFGKLQTSEVKVEARMQYPCG